ncbi:MAG TPA: hypothetical protein VMV58_01950 [Desulfosporosinus sp.]|nr:hypothetical protein [Desulfosporosinus sp.]
MSQLAQDPSLDPAPLMEGQVCLSLVGCSCRGLTCCEAILWAKITGLRVSSKVCLQVPRSHEHNEDFIYKRERLKRVVTKLREKQVAETSWKQDVSNRQLSHGWRIAGNSSERTALSVSLVYAAYGVNVVNKIRLNSCISDIKEV